MNRTQLSRNLARLFVILASCSLLGSCAAPPVNLEAMLNDWKEYMDHDYVLRPNDQVTVKVTGSTPSMTDIPEPQNLVIPPNGAVMLTDVETPIKAVGVPIRAFRAMAQEAYNKIYTDPVTVQVLLSGTAASSVFVMGDVVKTGAMDYKPNMTLSQVLGASGGFQYRAKLTDVRIVRATATNKPKTYRVDIDQVMHDEGHLDFIVLPGDVIYFQSVWAGTLADWLNLYLWNLLPLQGNTGRAAGGVGGGF